MSKLEKDTNCDACGGAVAALVVTDGPISSNTHVYAHHQHMSCMHPPPILPCNHRTASIIPPNSSPPLPVLLAPHSLPPPFSSTTALPFLLPSCSLFAAIPHLFSIWVYGTYITTTCPRPCALPLSRESFCTCLSSRSSPTTSAVHPFPLFFHYNLAPLLPNSTNFSLLPPFSSTPPPPPPSRCVYGTYITTTCMRPCVLALSREGLATCLTSCSSPIPYAVRPFLFCFHLAPPSLLPNCTNFSLLPLRSTLPPLSLAACMAHTSPPHAPGRVCSHCQESRACRTGLARGPVPCWGAAGMEREGEG
ncbi:unnamed protein product [Closterium sp. NIES-54]